MMTVSDPNAAMGDLSPLIRDAAAGNLEAQRSGRSMALAAMHNAAEEGNYVMGQGHAMEAMFWARFAASHGHVDDAIILAAVLTSLAKYWGYDEEGATFGNQWLAEAVALLDRLAGEGCEAAATAVNEISLMVAPRIFAQAKQVKELVDAGC
jgi:alcohol dehydrogenase class IV